MSSTSYNQRFPQNAPGTNNYNYDRSSNVSSPSTLQQFSTEQNNPSTNIPLSGPPETVTRGDLDQRKNMMTCPSLTQLRRNVELEVAETAQFCDSLKERVLQFNLFCIVIVILYSLQLGQYNEQSYA